MRLLGRFADVPSSFHEDICGVCGDWDKVVIWNKDGRWWCSEPIDFVAQVCVSRVSCGEQIVVIVEEGCHGLWVKHVRFSWRRFCFDARIVDVCCGQGHCLALLEDHSCFSFGENTSGQCGTGKEDEFVVDGFCRVFSSGVRTIACGTLHSVCVMIDGAAMIAGNTMYRQGGGLFAEEKQCQLFCKMDCNEQAVISAACGLFHTMLLLSTGNVLCFGYNSDGQTKVEGNNIVAVAAGSRHSVTLDEIGKVIPLFFCLLVLFSI
jgi:hypothetical protein